MQDSRDRQQLSHNESTTNSTPPGLVRLLLMGLVLFIIYTANGRPIGAFDTMPAIYLPVSIIRGDGPFLDRFSTALRPEGQPLPLYAVEARGHIVSRYPIGPAILAVPFELPQVLILDWVAPNWERKSPWRSMGIAKNSAAAIAALTSVLLFLLLRKLGLGASAIWATLAAALASEMWVIGSQSLWQHGPAALAMIALMHCLLTASISRARLLLAGFAMAALVCFRSIDVVIAACVFGWVIKNHRKDIIWFLPMPILMGLTLVSYNYYFFGTIAGGQAQLEKLHPEIHAVAGPWSGNILKGAAGTLFSPSHGLFTFTPWIAIALAMVPAIVSRLKSQSLVCWLLWAIIPYFLLLSKYSVWWGGHCFGPRYWTDLSPLFAIILGLGMDWSRKHSRPVFCIFVLTIVISLGVQIVGAFCYPSSWESSPVDVDQHHDRLWDWRDSELTRCLSEGIK